MFPRHLWWDCRNLNEIFAELNGSLFPFGWIRMIKHLKSRGVRTGRIPLMGVRKQFQSSPLGMALAIMVIDAPRQMALSRGVQAVELSWILEDNKAMRGFWITWAAGNTSATGSMEKRCNQCYDRHDKSSRLGLPMNKTDQFTAMVLAADRAASDPVAVKTGMACKAIAPICGTPMIIRVLDALEASDMVKTIIICGPPESVHPRLPGVGGTDRKRARHLAAESGFSQSQR